MIKVDNRETLRAAIDAETALREDLPELMLRAAKSGADYELAHKTYQNRTHRLRRNTKGRFNRNRSNDVAVDLVMDTEYASYVNARGYSAIDEAAARTREDIVESIRELGRRITSG